MIFWQYLRLRIEIALWRYGWCWIFLLILLLINIALYYLWLPQQKQTVAVFSERFQILKNEKEQRNQKAPATIIASNDSLMLNQLIHAAYESTEVSRVFKTIQDIAKTKGIYLMQSEIQSSAEGYGGFKQVQLTLPIRCSYPQLREFINTLLIQQAGISLDHILLKRDNVAQSQAEIHLKLSIWIRPENIKFTAIKNYNY